MNLSELIQRDTKEAMKSKDRTRVSALRMLSAALKNAELEAGQALTQEEQEAVLRKQLKQREESSESFREAGRAEQAEKEAAEAEIVRGYLPEPLARDEMEQIAERAIEETEANGMKDMGAVMARAMELAEGRAEGRELSALVRSRLQ